MKTRNFIGFMTGAAVVTVAVHGVAGLIPLATTIGSAVLGYFCAAMVATGIRYLRSNKSAVANWKKFETKNGVISWRDVDVK